MLVDANFCCLSGINQCYILMCRPEVFGQFGQSSNEMVVLIDITGMVLVQLSELLTRV